MWCSPPVLTLPLHPLLLFCSSCTQLGVIVLVVSHLRVIFENLLEHGLLMRVWGMSGGADYEDGSGSDGIDGSDGGGSPFVKVVAADRALLSAVYVASSADPVFGDGGGDGGSGGGVGDRSHCPTAGATGTDADGYSLPYLHFGSSDGCADTPSTAAMVLVVVMSWVATVGLVWLVEVLRREPTCDMQRATCTVYRCVYCILHPRPNASPP